MALFRKFNADNSSYVNSDIAVIDRYTGDLVFASLVGYSAVINVIQEAINKANNCYIENSGYYKTCPKGYEIEKKRQPNSEFVHMVVSKKDFVTEEDGTEKISTYLFARNEEELVDNLYDKLYKNTAVPLLKEWMPYIMAIMLRQRYMREVIVLYDSDGPQPFQCYSVNIRQDNLISIVSSGLRDGLIFIDPQHQNVSDSINSITGLDTYLNTYGEILANKIQESFVPKFVPGESSYDSKVEDYDDSCYDAGIEIFEAQKATIQASVNNLRKNDVTFVIGEMGTGKTLIGAGITYAHNQKRGQTTVVICPAHLTNKWKREVERFVPNGKAYIIKNLKQLIALDKKILNKKKTENMYIIISKETAKFGYEMRPSVLWSNSKRAFVCPECGKVLTRPVFEGTGRSRYSIDVKLTERDMVKPYAYNQVCTNKRKVWDKEKNRYEHVDCGAKLWTANNGDDNHDWVKLGAEGWVMKNHLTQIFNNLSSQQNQTRKDMQFLSKISDAKAELDAGVDITCSSRAPRKYQLARYIREHYKNKIDYLIADELYYVAPCTVMCM